MPADRSAKRMKTYLYLAVGLGIILPVGLSIIFRVATILSPPTVLDWVSTPPDSSQLQRAFFSGHPHILFCTNKTGREVSRIVRQVGEVATNEAQLTEEKRIEDMQERKTRAASEGLELDSDELTYPHLTPVEKSKSRKEGLVRSSPLPLTVATVDCWSDDLLPSGRSILQRFNLDQSLPAPLFPNSKRGQLAQPLPAGQSLADFIASTGMHPLPPALWVGGSNPRPRFLPNDLFLGDEQRVAGNIVGWVHGRAQSRTQPIQSEKFLHRFCTDRRNCIVLLHDGVNQLVSNAVTRVIRAVHSHYPGTNVATVDVGKYTLDLQRNLGKLDDPDQAKWPRLLYFKRQAKQSDTTATKDKNDNSSQLMVKSYKGAFRPSPIRSFIEAIIDRPSSTSVPSSATNTVDSDSKSTSKRASATSMAILKTPPRLNSGANNFKKAQTHNKNQRTQQQQQQQRQQEQRHPSKQTSSTSKTEGAATEREREKTRRAEMAAEEASSAFEARQGDEETIQHATPAEEDDGELVDLDEDADAMNEGGQSDL